MPPDFCSLILCPSRRLAVHQGGREIVRCAATVICGVISRGSLHIVRRALVILRIRINGDQFARIIPRRKLLGSQDDVMQRFAIGARVETIEYG